MEENGWIKIHRKFLKWEWYDDMVVKSVFLHLLLTANFETKKWRGITIERGQIVTGRKKLSQELGISERQVRTALKKLCSTNELTIKTTSKFSIVTICKYGSYQEKEKPSDQQSDQQNDQQATSKRPASDHN